MRRVVGLLLSLAFLVGVGGCEAVSGPVGGGARAAGATTAAGGAAPSVAVSGLGPSSPPVSAHPSSSLPVVAATTISGVSGVRGVSSPSVSASGWWMGLLLVPRLGREAWVSGPCGVAGGVVTPPADPAAVCYLGVAPGSVVGTTVLVGHSWASSAVEGVLERIGDLRVGDAAVLDRVYVADSSPVNMPKASLPGDVASPSVSGPRRLILVTCTLARVAGHSVENVIVRMSPGKDQW